MITGMIAEVGITLDLGEDLAAVEAGQVQVEKDQVGLAAVRRRFVAEGEQVIQGMTPVGDDRQAVRDVALAQRAVDNLGIGPAVLDQQDVEFRQRRVHPRQPRSSWSRSRSRVATTKSPVRKAGDDGAG